MPHPARPALLATLALLAAAACSDDPSTLAPAPVDGPSADASPLVDPALLGPWTEIADPVVGATASPPTFTFEADGTYLARCAAGLATCAYQAADGHLTLDCPGAAVAHRRAPYFVDGGRLYLEAFVREGEGVGVIGSWTSTAEQVGAVHRKRYVVRADGSVGIVVTVDGTPVVELSGTWRGTGDHLTIDTVRDGAPHREHLMLADDRLGVGYQRP
jgi:hypothetical protein